MRNKEKGGIKSSKTRPSTPVIITALSSPRFSLICPPRTHGAEIVFIKSKREDKNKRYAASSAEHSALEWQLVRYGGGEKVDNKMWGWVGWGVGAQERNRSTKGDKGSGAEESSG